MSYYIRRLTQAAISFVAGLFLTFTLYRLVPGGPVDAIMAQRIQDMREQGGAINQREIAQMVESLTGVNPDQPIPVAFYEYIRDIVLYQDFGESILYQDPVFDILFRAIPWSMFLSIYGIMLGFTATILVGVIMAWKEGTKIDTGATVLVMVMRSIPYYVAAIAMLSFLGFQWGLFPTGGRAPPAATPASATPAAARSSRAFPRPPPQMVASASSVKIVSATVRCAAWVDTAYPPGTSPLRVTVIAPTVI